jgi:hypothetical protein
MLDLSYYQAHEQITSFIGRKTFYAGIYASEFKKRVRKSDNIRFMLNLEVQLYELFKGTIKRGTTLYKALHVTTRLRTRTGSLEHDLSEALYYLLQKDAKNLENLMKIINKDHKIFIKSLLKFTVVRKMGLDRAYEILGTIEPLSNLIAKLPMPNLDFTITGYFVKGKVRTQEVLGGLTDSYQFPMFLVNPIGGVNKHSKIKYLAIIEGEYKTNITSKLHQKALKTIYRHDTGGVLFLERRKKHKLFLTPIYYDLNVQNLMKLYKAEEGFTLDESGLVFEGVINFGYEFMQKANVILKTSKEEEVLDVFGSKRALNKYLGISPQGIVIFRTYYEYITAPIQDFILDELYQPIGLTVDVKGEEKQFIFKVPNDLLENGIEHRAVRVKRGYLGHKMVSEGMASVIPMWASGVASCNICGGVTSPHLRDGICRKCGKALQRIIKSMQNSHQVFSQNLVGSFKTTLLGVTVEGSAGDGKVTLVREEDGAPMQMLLPFQEDLDKAFKALHRKGHLRYL